MGDAFEALHAAPRCAGLRGSLQCRADHAAVSEWRNQSGSVTMWFGEPAERSDLVFDVWVDVERRRARWDVEAVVTVVEGDQQVVFHPGTGALRRPAERLAEWPALLWSGRALLRAGELGDVAERVVSGRAAWLVRLDREPIGVRSPSPMWVVGDTVNLVVDQETGVVLRYEAVAAGLPPLVVASWEHLEFDPSIDDTVFDQAIPSAVNIRSTSEMLLDQLVAMGADLAGVDPNDEAAVHAAWRATNNSRRSHRPSGGEDVLAQYLPDGPPPTDPDQAQSAITAALAAFGQRSGDDLPNVEQGAGLATMLDEALTQSPYQQATLAVTAVRFLNDHHAVTTCDVLVNGNRMLPNWTARVVREQGRWKLARSAFAELLALAGVSVPPPHE